MRNYIKEVLQRYLANNYPKETERKIQSWIVDGTHSEDKKEYLYTYWKELKTEHISVKKSFVAVKEKAGITKSVSIPLRRKIMYIAAILFPLFILAGGYFHFMNRPANDLFVEINVPYGEKQYCVLPDGSTVWINAGSRLRYPKVFEEKTRIVELTGESYFVIAKDPLRPFTVKTKDLSVKVLGTEFNISAYPEQDRIVTTLKRGKVAIETKEDRSFILQPDEQLAYNTETSETILRPVKADEYSDWKSGNIIFEFMTLEEIFKVLERRYDLIINSSIPLDKHPGHYTIKFVNNETLEQILVVLSTTCGFEYELKEKTIRLSLNKVTEI